LSFTNSLAFELHLILSYMRQHIVRIEDTDKKATPDQVLNEHELHQDL